MRLRLFIISVLCFYGCSSFNDNNLANTEKFQIAVDLFDNKKYQKAKEYFEEIVQNEQGTNLGLESTFHLAKTLYELKEYEEASYNFNYFSMFSKDIENVEYSQYMKSKCAYELTLPYNKDQSSTLYAISIIQEFLDNFPYSSYKDSAFDMILKLRHRLGRKKFESGRLYLKMKKYDSALYYFDIIISEYYDTKFHDEALIYYIFTYIVMNEFDKANSYYENIKSNFNDDLKKDEAQQVLNDYKNGLGFKGLYKLYK